MATAAKIREAEKVSLAFHEALTALGVQATADALMLWRDVPAVPGVPGWAAWLPRTVRYVLLRRRRARALAKAYYRLNRALITGHVNAVGGQRPGTFTTLDDLRSDFNELLGYDYREAAPEAPAPAAEADPLEDALQDAEDVEEPEDDTDGSPEDVVVEAVDDLYADEDAIERDAEQEARDVIDALGRANLEDRLSKIGRKKERTAQEADAERNAAHGQAGARQAAAVGRLVQNGARSSIYASTRRDPRCIGYVRVSKTGTPCGWCAMLISRGLEYAYSTEARGTFTRSSASVSYEDGDRYHDNCYCYAMPIFSTEQYNNSDVFRLNREYSEKWPEVTKGLRGKAAVRAWRRYIRRQNATQEVAPQ